MTMNTIICIFIVLFELLNRNVLHHSSSLGQVVKYDAVFYNKEEMDADEYFGEGDEIEISNENGEVNNNQTK